MTATPAAGYFSNAARTNAEMKQALEDLASVLRELPGGQAISTLTIVGGSVTPDMAAHAVDTEGATATDDLANIVTTNAPDGRIVQIRCVSAARKVVVKHLAGGSGQMSLAKAKDVTLADPSMVLTLKLNGTTWEESDRARGTIGDWRVQPKAANFALTDLDFESIINCTATLTLTLAAAATLGNGFAFKVVASATTTIGGTVNGFVNPILLAGAKALIWTDGAAWFAEFNYDDAVEATVANTATPNFNPEANGSKKLLYNGTTTTTAITLANGVEVEVRLGGNRTITNGASLILPGAINIPGIAGDVLRFRGEAGSVVRCTNHTRIDGPAPGTMIGYFTSSDATAFTDASTFPNDDTIPQNNEGFEYTQLATSCTPKYANSLIEVSVFLPVVSNNAADLLMALFRDSVAGALAVSKLDIANTNTGSFMELTFTEVAGNTQARTYKIRLGGLANSTTALGGDGINARFGAARIASMTVREIRQ